MWGRSAAVGAVVAAVLGVPVTSASAVRHFREFNSPDRTIYCVLEGCEATLTPPLTNPSSQYTGFFTSTGKLQTCAAAPPFSVSHPGCIMHFFDAPVLAFGETNEIEGLRCTSASDGVTCTKVAGAGAGKGFRINAHEVVRVGSASSGSSPVSQPVYFWPSLAVAIRSPDSSPLQEVKHPSAIGVFADGSWVLEGLHWTHWGSSVAHATGISSASNGIPNQAQGKRIKTPAEITLSKPGKFFGREVYRCYAMKVLPPATSAHGCLTHVNGGSWYLTV
jgi:hypothetical protein